MRIRKAALFILLVWLVPALSACAGEEYSTIEEAVSAGAVLGRDITVDGLDVSDMSVLEARKLITSAQRERVEALELTVLAGEDSVSIRGSELKISFDTDAVLLRATSLPRTGGARDFTCEVFADMRRAERLAAEAALSLHREAKDASSYFDPEAEDGFSYTQGEYGREIDAQALASELYERALRLEGGPVETVCSELPPARTMANAMEDTQLIAQFSTSFKGSTYSKANRVYNIVKAAELIDGVTIAPGEGFSMNAALGARNEENGWRTATAIRSGAYVQEYGGGVCQVSTTLYNAALMAGLNITERNHHSWPLGYIDAGRDATISTGGPDLCLENSSSAPIFIRAAADTDEKRISVSIYGRPLENGVSIRLTSKKTETLADPGTEIQTDNSLSPGEEKVVREARTGVVTETYAEYYAADGSYIKRELVSRDKYRSIKGLVYIGPAASPEQTPEETPVITPSPDGGAAETDAG